MQNEWLIISGTSRKGSKSLQVAKAYQQLLSAKNLESKILALENLPHPIFNINSKSEELKQLENSTIIPAQKIIFEYANFLQTQIPRNLERLNIKKMAPVGPYILSKKDSVKKY